MLAKRTRQLLIYTQKAIPSIIFSVYCDSYFLLAYVRVIGLLSVEGDIDVKWLYSVSIDSELNANYGDMNMFVFRLNISYLFGNDNCVIFSYDV